MRPVTATPLSAPDWARVKAVFDAALAVPAAERAAWLAEACGPNEALRTEVESLLASHEGAGAFLATAADAEAARAFPDEEGPSLIGRRVGPYRLIAEIGRGGMGAVYAAVRADDQYEQRVAVKVVKRGMDTDFILQRFRSERQILAGLDHPNIARLLDGGTTEDGLPYFVMEYIEGEAIHHYAEGGSLSTRQRLELFRAVCSAVHYAHQNLIVHRDIKPTNILVTAAGVPKLLDFGIAKLLNPASFPETIAPTQMAQRLMTPDYASPEQVRGEPITTASDVYSLGVLLYELLTGQRPYHLRSADMDELIRVICDEEPRPPSEAVGDPSFLPQFSASAVPSSLGGDSTAAHTLTLTPLARTHVRPERLRRELAGDLDTIILMALRKEPRRRYGSVEQLSDDLRRHLEGRPVTARKDTLLYRTGKFVRRNRAMVAAGVMSVLALGAGLVGTAWQAREARVARARAERRFNDVRKLATSFLFEFHDAIETLPGSTKARELVVKRALEYLDSLAQEADSPGLRRDVAEAYRRVGDVQGNPYGANLGDTAGALASYRKALDVDQAWARDTPVLEARLAVSTDHNKVGDLLLQSGDVKAALQSHENGLRVAEDLAREMPGQPAVLRRVFVGHTKVGEAQERLSDLAGSRASYDRALVAAEAQAAADQTTPKVRRDLSVAHLNVGNAKESANDPKGALESYRRALAIRETLLARDPANTLARYDIASVSERVGALQATLGDLPGALATQRKGLEVISAVAAADPANAAARRGMAISHASVATLLARLGQDKEALAGHQQALALRETLSGSDPSNAALQAELAESLVAVGETQARVGRREEGCRLFVRAGGIYERLSAAGKLPPDRAGDPTRLAALRKSCPLGVP